MRRRYGGMSKALRGQRQMNNSTRLLDAKPVQDRPRGLHREATLELDCRGFHRTRQGPFPGREARSLETRKQDVGSGFTLLRSLEKVEKGPREDSEDKGLQTGRGPAGLDLFF